MDELGLWVPASVFRGLPQNARDALMAALGTASISPGGAAPGSGVASGAEPADFTVAQARDFLAGCSQKVKDAVRVAANGQSRFFQLADIAKALNVGANDLRGVWTGITKRTRTVLNNRDARLIWWAEGGETYAPDGTYIDHRGWFSETTYQSFRQALSLN